MNLSLIDGNYRDGHSAARRNNDNIQLQAQVSQDSMFEGLKVYTPVVCLDTEAKELMEENNRLLRVMIGHLAKLTEISISEDELDEHN